MKILNKIWGIGLLAILLTALGPRQTMAQGGYVSNQVFYDELSPYGTWVYDNYYGNVWIPDAEDGFRPYGTRGHWVLTEYGNTWVSDYAWGWATFHYGRWRFDDYYGWMWLPDNEWGPAWVNWRQGGGYYGWAPLGPGISINIALGGNYRVPDIYWTYAPEVYINSPRVYDYYVPRTQVVNIINRTTIINNTVVINNRRYVGGPRFNNIRRSTRTAPQVYKVNDARRPGAVNINNNTVNIYKPNVTVNNNARPTRVVDGDAYRRANPNERIAANSRRGADNDRANAARLAAAARSEKPDDKIVRVNNDRAPVQSGDNRRGNRDGQDRTAPNVTGRAEQQAERRDRNNIDNTPDVLLSDQNPAQRRQQRPDQIEEQRRQQNEQREIRRQQVEQNRSQGEPQSDQAMAQRSRQNEQQRQQEQQMQREQQRRGQQEQQQRQLEQQRRQEQQMQREQQRRGQLEQQQQRQMEQQRRQEQQMQREQQRRGQMEQQQQRQVEQQRQQEQQMQREQQRRGQMEQQQQRQVEQQRQQEQQQQRQVEQQRQQRRQEQQMQRQQQMPQQGGDTQQQGRGRRG